METADVVVIGAGVVGLAVARALAERGREVLVLEGAAAIGTGTSSRNSEVIHAGIYYPTGSLKARLCVQGKAMLYRYCAERGVAHRRCGKLIVANTASQAAALPAIVQKAQANRVDDLVLLTREQAQAMEPHLECLAAVHSPSTGIVDSHALMLALQGDLENMGGLVACHSAVERLRVTGQGIEVDAADGTVLLARSVVNAAGLHACALGRNTLGLDPSRVPRAWYAKGNYFTLAGRSPFDRLVYPAPEPDKHLASDRMCSGPMTPTTWWWTRPVARLFMPRCASTGPDCPTARCSQVTRACGRRSAARTSPPPTSESTARLCTAYPVWSICSVSSHQG